MTARIFEAIENSDIAGLERLLRIGEDPNQVEVDSIAKIRPLHAAVIAYEDVENPEAIKLLLHYGADINLTSLGIGGGTPLLCAMFNDMYDLARFLVAQGADPNIRGEEGHSPLRWCVAKGDHEMALFLLSNSAKKTINEFGGWEGRTALGMSVKRLDEAMVELLLNEGADPSVRDLDHHSAFDCLPMQTAENQAVWNRINTRLVECSVHRHRKS